ncbi:hypothetical protein L9F63_006011, partial [Diploptera punctata]
MATDDWEGYCNHVESLKKRHWDRDGLVSDLVDSIIIEDANSDENSSYSDSEDHSYTESGEDLSDSELAPPLY